MTTVRCGSCGKDKPAGEGWFVVQKFINASVVEGSAMTLCMDCWHPLFRLLVAA